VRVESGRKIGVEGPVALGQRIALPFRVEMSDVNDAIPLRVPRLGWMAKNGNRFARLYVIDNISGDFYERDVP
jgi:hypothetical protein